MTGAAVLTAAGPALAENQPLTCWYNDHADFTSADHAASDATIGAVTKYGSGDKTYTYTISARDGNGLPDPTPALVADGRHGRPCPSGRRQLWK